MATVTNPSKRKRYLCGHCNELLGKTLYYSHKQLCYDQEARKWSRDHRVHIATEGEEFLFPPHDASHSSFG